MSVTEDQLSGEVASITTRKAPGRYEQEAQHLVTETLTIQAKGFFNLTAPVFVMLVAFMSMLLILLYLAVALGLGWLASLQDVAIAVLGSLVALVALVLVPRRVRKP